MKIQDTISGNEQMWAGGRKENPRRGLGVSDSKLGEIAPRVRPAGFSFTE